MSEDTKDTKKIISLPFNLVLKTKLLLQSLNNERTLDVLKRRYGLGAQGAGETLESVGQSYGITRERVRQIENHAIKSIRKSTEYSNVSEDLRALADIIEGTGGVLSESELLDMLADTERIRNHLLFLLAVGEKFKKKKENPEFTGHWYLDETHAHNIREALRKLYKGLEKDIVLPEEEIAELYADELGLTDKHDIETIIRWLRLSKKIAKNPLGEWGLASSPAVRVKGIRDFAYLTLKRSGSPMHFKEVAEGIKELFGREAHKATTHNELIKDKRFVLVGRGLYALTEWGYTQGVVKDVIKKIDSLNYDLEDLQISKSKEFVTKCLNLYSTSI